MLEIGRMPEAVSRACATGDVPGTPFEVEDLHGGFVLRLLLCLLEVDRRFHERRARCDRRLARDAEDRQQVRPVRLDLDVEHRVVETQRRLEVRARREACGQDEDPLVVPGDAELPGRAEHALRHDAADLPRGERLVERGHPGARRSERHDVPGSHIANADDDLPFGGARAHPHEAQVVGSRMVAHLHHACGDDAGQALPRPQDGFDLDPDRREALPEGGGRA